MPPDSAHPITLGDEIRRLMRKRGLTGRDLAAGAHLSVTSVSLILGNKYLPRRQTLAKIERALAVTKEERESLDRLFLRDASPAEGRLGRDMGAKADALEATTSPLSRTWEEFENEIRWVLSAEGYVVKETVRSLPSDLLIETDPKVVVVCKPSTDSSDWFDAMGRALYRRHLLRGSRAIIVVPFKGRYFEQLKDFFQEHGVDVATPDTLVGTIERLTAHTGKTAVPGVQTDILRKMHRTNAALMGKRNDAWGARLLGWRDHEMIFDATADNALWTDPATRKDFKPDEVLGRKIENEFELLQAMQAEGFSPVYEGAHIDQFLFGTQPVRFWLKLELAKAEYGFGSSSGPLLVCPRITSNTDQKSCKAAVLPSGSAASATLWGFAFERVDIEAAAVVLNSFCFDYAFRQRMSGPSVTTNQMRYVPVPPASLTNSLPRIPTVCGWEHGIKNITELKEQWVPLWIANKAVAQAYGLSQDDFRHVLAAFPVFAKMHKEFFDFLKTRLDTEPW